MRAISRLLQVRRPGRWPRTTLSTLQYHPQLDQKKPPFFRPFLRQHSITSCQTFRAQQATRIEKGSISELVDAVALEEGWFQPQRPKGPPFSTILDYLADKTSLDSTVSTIINLYKPSCFCARTGNAIRCPEKVAPQTKERFATEERGDLWDLWYSVLHAARRTPWQEESDKHVRLVELVRALKALPDGYLSYLPLLVPSTRESWHNSPGCSAGYSAPSVTAWTNVNAFVARLTHEDVSDFKLYAIWALRYLEEKEIDQKPEELDAHVPAAVTWIMIMGEAILACEEDFSTTDPRHGDPARPGNLMVERTGSSKSAFTSLRWEFWKKRFLEISKREDLRMDTRSAATSAYKEMCRVQETLEAQTQSIVATATCSALIIGLYGGGLI